MYVVDPNHKEIRRKTFPSDNSMNTKLFMIRRNSDLPLFFLCHQLPFDVDLATSVNSNKSTFDIAKTFNELIRDPLLM